MYYNELMSQNLRKIFFSLLKTKKKVLVFFFSLFLGLTLPLQSAQAIPILIPIAIAITMGTVGLSLGNLFDGQIIWSSITNVAIAFVTLFLQLPLMATNVLLSVAIGILAITTSPNFIGLSYTNPEGNQLLAIGWTLTRDLANMGFVIILVVIGLATALRIQDYQWQKTLPRLIAVALLINFTPVLLGLIVDAANIIMQFFLRDMINWEFLGNVLRNQVDTTLGLLENPVSPAIDFTSLGRTIVLISFGLIAGFMILAFALLFIIRYIAIWMLVILSPLAFAAYILPRTKEYFTKWWSQFLQWCFIGATAAFFLYLTTHLLGLAPTLMRVGLPEETSGDLPGLINTLLPYSVAIGFLIFGFFTALSTSAMGASGVISAAQKGATTVGAWAQKKGIGMAGARARKTWEESGRARKFRERMTDLAKAPTPKPGWGKGQAGIGAWFKRRAAGVVGTATALPYAGARATGGALGPGFIEAEKAQIDKAEKEVEKASVDMVISKFRSAADWATKIGYMNRLVKQGDLETAIKAGLTPNEIVQTGSQAAKYRQEKDIIAAVPHLAEEMGVTLKDEDRDKGYITVADKIIDEMKVDRIKNMSPSVLKDAGVKEAMYKFWDGRHLGEGAKIFGRTFVEDYMEGAESPEKGLDWFLENNPKALAYLSGNAAQDLGLRAPGGLTSEKAREEIGLWRMDIRDIDKGIAEKKAKIKELPQEAKEELKKEEEGLKQYEDIRNRKQEFEKKREKREKEKSVDKKSPDKPGRPSYSGKPPEKPTKPKGSPGYQGQSVSQKSKK